MLFSRAGWFLILVVAGALGAYKVRALSAPGVLLVLLTAGVVGFVWRSVGARKNDGTFDDPSISTLVFPPESKFEQSALPRR